LGLDQPRIRLAGVKCENFRVAGEAPEQLTLDTLGAEDPGSSRPAADQVIDAARARFGTAAMGYGTLLPTALPTTGQNDRATGD
ncbi:MAG: hypothetical protein QOF95_2451, partial [Pseudonocardiales bacterium]|nr:hypothetical protein [Pseudonocardiales bacterium]